MKTTAKMYLRGSMHSANIPCTNTTYSDSTLTNSLLSSRLSRLAILDGRNILPYGGSLRKLTTGLINRGKE